jgi:lipid II:glycine glycyltransferase (peptidoglycan interpeptide bridge formation enzyme)
MERPIQLLNKMHNVKMKKNLLPLFIAKIKATIKAAAWLMIRVVPRKSRKQFQKRF